METETAVCLLQLSFQYLVKLLDTRFYYDTKTYVQNRFFINFLDGGHLDIMLVPEMPNLAFSFLCARIFR